MGPMDHPLDRLRSSLHSKISSRAVSRLRAGVAELHRVTSGRLRWGSVCSGTDLIAIAFNKLFEVWHRMFGIQLISEHCFSCENAGVKQKFLQDVFNPPHIFPDVTLLNETVVRDLAGKDVQVPPAAWNATPSHR
jgi:hypothetical protein